MTNTTYVAVVTDRRIEESQVTLLLSETLTKLVRAVNLYDENEEGREIDWHVLQNFEAVGMGDKFYFLHLIRISTESAMRTENFIVGPITDEVIFSIEVTGEAIVDHTEQLSHDTNMVLASAAWFTAFCEAQVVERARLDTNFVLTLAPTVNKALEDVFANTKEN